MNKFYKVVWSKVKNCYVVVSEISKNVLSGSGAMGVNIVKGMTLGTFMALSITGNVLAAPGAEEELALSSDSFGVEVGRGNTEKFDELNLNVNNKGMTFAIRANYDGSIDVNDLYATVNGGEWVAGIEATHDGVVNIGDAELHINDNGKEGCEAYGINVARKGTVNINGDLVTTVNGGEWANGVEAYNGSNVRIGNDSSEVTIRAITRSNQFEDTEWGIRAHGIFAVGQTVPIVADDEEEGEEAYGGSVVNINAKQFTVRTTANADNAYGVGIYAEDNSVVKVKSNIDIEAGGYNAYGVEAINGSNVELGKDSKDVSIITSCKGDTGNSIAVYAVGENSKVDIVADELTIKANWGNKADQKRRSLVAENKAVINIVANDSELLGRIVATKGSEINIDTSMSFNNNIPLDVRDNSQINLIGGVMSGVIKIVNGNVNLTGATFKADRLFDSDSSDNINDSNILGSGKLVLDDNGILRTNASEVFSYIQTTHYGEDIYSVRQNDRVVYKAGAVSLSEDYSYDYLNSVLKAMKEHEYENGKTSSTKIIMTGKLTDSTLTADQASSLGNQVELDRVTVETGNSNLLIGGSVGNVDISETLDGVSVGVSNGFAANCLDLGTATGAIVTGGQELTLGGSTGNNNIVSNDNNNTKLVVGGDITGIDNSKGKLNIGNAAANGDSKYNLNGSVKVNPNSALNTKGQTTITGGVELESGNLDVHEDGHLYAHINAKGNSKITGKVTGDLEVDDKHPSTMVYLGNDKKAAKMNAEHSKLKGGTLFLDPAYANGIEYASAFALKNADTLDGAYIAGQNSVISFGVNSTDMAEKVFERTGFTFGSGTRNGHTVIADIDAAVYIKGTISVQGGSITADGSLTTDNVNGYASNLDSGDVYFGNKSLLMVEAESVKEKFAITDVSNVNVDTSAKLYIDDAVKNETYKILSGTGIDVGWLEENILTNGQLVNFKVVASDDGTTYEVNTGVRKVRDVYGDAVVIADVVDAAVFAEISATDFFNDTVNEKVNATKEAQVDAMNSVGSINELAGVSHTTYAVSNILTDAVADHMSLVNSKEHDKDIWAHYVHTKENIDGLQRAGKYDAQYNGIVVGADIYKEGKATVGAALTYVDGNINGSTLAASTENDAKYYGAIIYGSIENKDAAVIADVSYLHGEHDITQRNSGATITGKPESDAFSVGVRVEQAAKAGIGKLVPYAGIRYMHLGTGNYANSIGLAYNTEDAELFLLPVGLKYSSEVKNTNGWTVRPVVELGYVWAFGDTDTNQTVSLNGASNGFGYDVTDSGSYVGRFMLEAEKANISYALGYEYQKGDDVKADKWMVNVNWNF